MCSHVLSLHAGLWCPEDTGPSQSSTASASSICLLSLVDDARVVGERIRSTYVLVEAEQSTAFYSLDISQYGFLVSHRLLGTESSLVKVHRCINPGV